MLTNNLHWAIFYILSDSIDALFVLISRQLLANIVLFVLLFILLDPLSPFMPIPFSSYDSRCEKSFFSKSFTIFFEDKGL